MSIIKLMLALVFLVLVGCVDTVNISLQRDGSDLQVMSYQDIVEQYSENNESLLQYLNGTDEHNGDDPYLTVGVLSDRKLERASAEEGVGKMINGSFFQCGDEDIQTPADSLYVGQVDDGYNYVFATSIERLKNTQILSKPLKDLCISILEYEYHPITTPNTKYVSNEIVFEAELVEDTVTDAGIEVLPYQEQEIIEK